MLEGPVTAPPRTAPFAPGVPVPPTPPAVSPVLPGLHPDPSACRVGEHVYLVTSSFGYHPGLPIHRSRDLRQWDLVGHVLEGDSWLPLSGLALSDGIWAPTIRWHAGRFIVVVTVARDRTGSTSYLTTATDAAGPWTPPVPLEGVGIDPDRFVDDDGRAWVSVARDATVPGKGPGEIWMRELDLETLDLVGPEHVLWHGALAGQWIEAPHIYRRGGRYHLICAEGGTGRHHSVTAASSDVVTGPYTTDPRSPLLTHRHLGEGASVQCVGHADLVESADGAWWALVLGTRPIDGHHALGRETFLAPVAWDERGPVIAPGVGRLEAVADGGSGAGARVDTDPRPAAWVSLRGPVRGEVVGDAVVLHPEPVGPHERGTPAFLGRRQDRHAFTFGCRLDVATIGASDAGVVALQDEATLVALRVRATAAGPVARVEQRLGGEVRVLAERPVRGSVALGIASDGRRYDLLLDGEVLASVPHRELSSEASDSFVGVVLGVVNECPADGPPLTFAGVSYKAR